MSNDKENIEQEKKNKQSWWKKYVGWVLTQQKRMKYVGWVLTQQKRIEDIKQN